MKWNDEFGRQPSQVTDAPWAAMHLGEELTPRVGKWMVFCTFGDDLDETWMKIMVAMLAGRLGPAGKASTGYDVRDWGSPIMVSTKDADDREDVARVLGGLRDLGISQRLSYKEDAATYAGRYGRGSARYVSQPGSREMEERGPAGDGEETLF